LANPERQTRTLTGIAGVGIVGFANDNDERPRTETMSAYPDEDVRAYVIRDNF
jgi:hypothetical protein